MKTSGSLIDSFFQFMVVKTQKERFDFFVFLVHFFGANIFY